MRRHTNDRPIALMQRVNSICAPAEERDTNHPCWRQLGKQRARDMAQRRTKEIVIYQAEQLSSRRQKELCYTATSNRVK